PAERIGVLVGALAAVAARVTRTLAHAHAILLHRLRQTLRALAHGFERAPLAVDRPVGVAFGEFAFGLAHGFAGIAELAHAAVALVALAFFAFFALLAFALLI